MTPEFRDYKCVVDGHHLYGTVTGKIGELADYNVGVRFAGLDRLVFRFLMVLVASTRDQEDKPILLYVVIKIEELSTKNVWHITPVRNLAADCFELTLKDIVNLKRVLIQEKLPFNQ
jgi:hypothetical protein